jgi:hypothetical protein
MDLDDYVEVEDTDAEDTEPERVQLPLRAAALTPKPERFPLRLDTWGEITRDTITDAFEFTPIDTWIDDSSM